MEQKRPYVFTCSGMSLDGKISTYDRKQVPIASIDNREILFDSRVRTDAVMIGGGQLIVDDPKLTVKTEQREQERLKQGKSVQPIKVAVVSDISKINRDGEFFNSGDGQKILFTTERSSKDLIEELNKICKIYVCGKEKVDLKDALSILYELGVKTLMVEGGGELLYSLFKDDLIDEINITHGNLILGGRNAPTLCDGEGFSLKDAKSASLIDVKKVDDSLQLKYLVNKK